jgi:hypothetical protein
VQEKRCQEFRLMLGAQNRHERGCLSTHRWKISPI